MRFPVYRYLIIDGVCRQDEPGGRWHPLTLEETDALLARFDGLALMPMPPRSPLPMYGLEPNGALKVVDLGDEALEPLA